MLDITATRESIKSGKRLRCAWDRGVVQYVEDFLQWLEEEELSASLENTKQLRAVLLNGAKDWKDYSDSGSALIWSKDIAERLCTSAQLRDFRARVPHMLNLDWFELQSRALHQAWLILRIHAVFTPVQCSVTE